jgi:hypothetical protein
VHVGWAAVIACCRCLCMRPDARISCLPACLPACRPCSARAT